MGELGFFPTVVERPRNKLEAISVARCAFARCQFDEEACELGLKRLRAYRKEWDDDRGVWKDRPATTKPPTAPTPSSPSRAAASPRPRPPADSTVRSITAARGRRALGSDGGRTTAGGLFMSSYTPMPVQSVRAPARARAPRRSHAPASLSEAVSLGALSPSEAASLQSIADSQY